MAPKVICNTDPKWPGVLSRLVPCILRQYLFFVGMFDAISEGKEASVAYFNNWVDEVKRTVPKEKLLIFSVKEGWGPLCKFLDAPIPEVPFPNTNDSAQMKKYVKLNQIKAYSFVVGAPILLGICTYFFVKKGKLPIITNVFSNFLSMIKK